VIYLLFGACYLGFNHSFLIRISFKVYPLIDKQ